MQASIVQTLSIPLIGQTAALITQAGALPTRVQLRNTGGSLVFLAHDVNALTDVTSLGAVYQLPAGAGPDVFVLAPGQSLFAVSTGAGGQVSVAISEAVPERNFA